MKLFIKFVAVVTVVAAVFSVVSFASGCAEVRHDVLRLHVVGASDSEFDQSLKLKVRDAVLEKGGELFDGTVTADEAEKIITPRIDELKAVAEEVLKENGCDYKVDIQVGEEYFTTRCYENFTMPAGVYNAVRVNIGSAEGKNWWCVMFPPLCFTDGATGKMDNEGTEYLKKTLSEDEYRLISLNDDMKFKFKIIEIFK